MRQSDKLLCPSARAKEGARLIGIRQDDGTISILPTALSVDADFLENTRLLEEPPEQRFRFANKCVETGCVQWTGKSCGVADEMVRHLNRVAPDPTLRACAIRPQCRWHHQSGAEACQMCTYVITQITEQEATEYFSNADNL
jgi:hypothetical protein